MFENSLSLHLLLAIIVALGLQLRIAPPGNFDNLLSDFPPIVCTDAEMGMLCVDPLASDGRDAR